MILIDIRLALVLSSFEFMIRRSLFKLITCFNEVDKGVRRLIMVMEN